MASRAAIALALCVACVHAEPLPPRRPLEFDFDLEGATFDSAGHVHGKLLVSVKSGFARFVRDSEPQLMEGPTVECGTRRSVRTLAVDYFILREDVSWLEIADGQSRKFDVNEGIFQFDGEPPNCLDAELSVMARNATDPDHPVWRTKSFRLMRR